LNSSVCTLFEGNYHYGVAALVNSLCVNGFEGIIYAGYRGDRPMWAIQATDSTVDRWRHATTLHVTEKVSVIFLPLDTDYHLTNYKPDFMLDLIAGLAGEETSLFYLDPDIVINEHWKYFTEWVSCGVALCEDVNSPLAENHPRRTGWRRFYASKQMYLSFKSDRYVNGGCVGTHPTHKSFLETWKECQEMVSQTVGGSSAAKISGGQALSYKGFANCFDSTDQDALNAAVECTKIPCSILGQEAMGFKTGRAILPHALGPNKPWERSYFLFALKGSPPRSVDKLYWQYASGPITVHSLLYVTLKRLSIKLASFIGRFYRRS